jgi:hypothetical protein
VKEFMMNTIPLVNSTIKMSMGIAAIQDNGTYYRIHLYQYKRGQDGA